MRQPSRNIVLESTEPAELIDKMTSYQPPQSLISLLQEGKIDKRLRG